MQVTPASTNDSTIAGPESPIASPMMTKMPVPMIAPTPSAVRSSAPTERRSRVPSAASSSCSLGLVTKAPGRATVAIALPRYPRRVRLSHPGPGIPDERTRKRRNGHG